MRVAGSRHVARLTRVVSGIAGLRVAKRQTDASLVDAHAPLLPDLT